MADVPLLNNPMTTAGDVIQGGASGVPSRLAIGTAGQVLTVNAGATAAEWAAGGSGSFNPDTHLPWHVSIVPTIWTADATTGTWTVTAASDTSLLYPFYSPGSVANSGRATELEGGAVQNDAIAWDVILAAGTWDAHLWVRRSTNTGIITLNEDGASKGTVDTYAAAPAAAKLSITGWTVATTGKKRMQILMATKNASSSAYVVGLFAVEFRRTA